MPPPTYPATDYLWQFQRLLPRGRVWHRGWGLVQDELLLTLMQTWARLNDRAANLVADAFPCTTLELLPEWEATLGLPSDCTGPLPTIQQRQAAVCAKFSSRGGQSIAYYQAIAEALGYTITVTQFSPFRADINTVGQPLNGEAWAYTWLVTGPEQTVTYFRTGQSTAGEPLAIWGNELLECTIRAYAPAHTILIFAYPVESIWDGGESIWDAGDSRWDVRIQPEPDHFLRMRLPAALVRAFLDRASAEGQRAERLFASVWEFFARHHE